MSEILLDQDKIVANEPFENVARRRITLSSFALPASINAQGKGDRVLRVGFGYPGGEKAGDAFALDKKNFPQIRITVGAVTRKIITIKFTPPIAVSDLMDVSKRLNNAADEVDVISQRLSYRMIAKIISEVATPGLQAFVEQGGLNQPDEPPLRDFKRDR